MLLYRWCQAEPIFFVPPDGKAARAAGLFPVFGESRSMPVIRQQAKAGKHQQYNNRQEQVCYADRLPYGAYHRHSCTWPIQQHTGICQYITPYHNAEQRRARKGGARGGKAGFVTLSAFPPRKPVHAQVSPRKGKEPTAQVFP